MALQPECHGHSEFGESAATDSGTASGILCVAVPLAVYYGATATASGTGSLSATGSGSLWYY